MTSRLLSVEPMPPDCQDASGSRSSTATESRSSESRKPRRYSKYADRILGTREQRRAAKLAMQEFRDVVRWSDAWLLFTLVFFALLGNLYPVKRHSEILVGVAGFVVFFLVYVAMSAREKRLTKAREQQLSR